MQDEKETTGAEKEKKDSNKREENTKEASSVSPAAKIMISIIILAVAIFLITSFQKNIKERGAIDKCKEIENHPDLNFRGTCIPLDDTGDTEDDTVETKSDPLCRCTFDLGNGTLWTTDIRVAKQ